ncbi:MAG: nucleoside triphosphate pyrophosphohydrolase [Verrucomicrobia bacterium]|nr:nucleoside triphosphate pyrophosphohydrolase [Verrucomicrobiota bacterium]
MAKLVRDLIPQIIPQEKMHLFRFTEVSENEYANLLKQKLREEIDEYLEAENLEELADVYEVLEAIIKAKKFDVESLKNVQIDKRLKRGGFEKRLLMEEVRCG